MVSDLNNWEKLKIIHKNKIKKFEFLKKHKLIIHIESDYFYSVDDIENKYYKLKCDEIGLDEDVIEKVDEFIKKLNEYNEIKDVAEALIGKIAELKNLTIKEMRKELETPE